MVTEGKREPSGGGIHPKTRVRKQDYLEKRVISWRATYSAWEFVYFCQRDVYEVKTPPLTAPRVPPGGGQDPPKDGFKEAKLVGKVCDKLKSDAFGLGIRVHF